MIKGGVAFSGQHSFAGSIFSVGVFTLNEEDFYKTSLKVSRLFPISEKIFKENTIEIDELIGELTKEDLIKIYKSNLQADAMTKENLIKYADELKMPIKINALDPVKIFSIKTETNMLDGALKEIS